MRLAEWRFPKIGFGARGSTRLKGVVLETEVGSARRRQSRKLRRRADGEIPVITRAPGYFFRFVSPRPRRRYKGFQLAREETFAKFLGERKRFYYYTTDFTRIGIPAGFSSARKRSAAAAYGKDNIADARRRVRDFFPGGRGPTAVENLMPDFDLLVRNKH